MLKALKGVLAITFSWLAGAFLLAVIFAITVKACGAP